MSIGTVPSKTYSTRIGLLQSCYAPDAVKPL